MAILYATSGSSRYMRYRCHSLRELRSHQFIEHILNSLKPSIPRIAFEATGVMLLLNNIFLSEYLLEATGEFYTDHS